MSQIMYADTCRPTIDVVCSYASSQSAAVNRIAGFVSGASAAVTTIITIAIPIPTQLISIPTADPNTDYSCARDTDPRTFAIPIKPVDNKNRQ